MSTGNKGLFDCVSSEEGQNLLFLKKKKQKDFWFLGACGERTFLAVGLAAALLLGCHGVRAADATPADPGVCHPAIQADDQTAWLEHRKDTLDLGLVFKENAK
jgi:hypothetical protein